MAGPVTVRALSLEDRLALWEWRQDPMTRALFPYESEAAYDQHRHWFDQVMASTDTVWCIGVVETLRIGCVRFDRIQGDEYAVSLFLKPAYCGKELARALLRAAIDHVRSKRRVDTLVARIPNTTSASGALFRSLGFSITEEGCDLRCELACSPLASAEAR